MSISSQSKRYLYLFLYCYVFFCMGLYSNSVGSLIIYLAEVNKIPQTEYSFLFNARTLGSVIGIAIYKSVQKTGKKNQQHKILSYSGLTVMIFMILFVLWDSRMGQWISMSMIGAAYYTTISSINICILNIVDKKNGFEVLMGYGTIGVGAIVSPRIIEYFEQKSYIYMSLFFLLMFILFQISPMPQQDENKNKNNAKEVRKSGSSYLVFLFALTLFLVKGMQLTVTGWVPSYAVITGVSSKTQTAIFTTIYYILVILMRFVSPLIKWSNTRKLLTMLTIMLASSFFCLYCQFRGEYLNASMYGSLFYGFSCSLLYPLVLVLPNQYDVYFRADQTANLLIGNVFSGFLTGFTGMLMKIDTQLLFFSLLGISISIFGVVGAIIRQLRNAPTILETNKVEKQDKKMK